MSFDSLPNEMLDIILNQSDIPLQERIKLRRISPRCLTVIEGDLKKQPELIITEVPPPQPVYEPKTLHLHDAKYLTAELFQLLGRLFTAVDNLCLRIGSDEFFGLLPGLLHQFSATLKNLDLCNVPFLSFFDDHQYPLKLLPPMAMAINSLTKLTSLSSEAKGLHVFFFTNLAPTLARLESFTIKDDYDFDYRGNRSRHFDLAIFAALSNRCTDLRCRNVSTMSITQIVQRMPSLRNLALSFMYDKDMVLLQTAMFRKLSTLTQLVELRLETIEYDAEKISLPSATDNRLSTVKRLHLEMGLKYHDLDDSEDDFDAEDYDKYLAKHVKKDKFNFKHLSKALAAWFPALEQLTIVTYVNFFKVKNLERFLDAVIKQNLNKFLSSVDVKTSVTVNYSRRH